jgi:predicted TIM-barrel fold metal-dependent hydrolase
VVGFPLETTVAIGRLICAGVLDRYPRLELVLVHGGGYFPYQPGRLRQVRAAATEDVVRTIAETNPARMHSFAG